MDYINHWIPAFAGMTTGVWSGGGGCDWGFVRNDGRGLSEYRSFLLLPRCHSGEGRNPGGRGPGFNGCRVSWEGAGGLAPVDVIPADAGMDYINHWIPAFAGMTAGALVRNLSGMTEGEVVTEYLSGMTDGACRNTAHFHFCPVVIPAKAGIQGGEARGLMVVGFRGRARGVLLLWMSFPLTREWIT